MMEKIKARLEVLRQNRENALRAFETEANQLYLLRIGPFDTAIKELESLLNGEEDANAATPNPR